MLEFIKAIGTALLAFVPLVILWNIVFGVLERFFPVIQLKSLKGWAFNAKVSLLSNSSITQIFEPHSAA